MRIYAGVQKTLYINISVTATIDNFSKRITAMRRSDRCRCHGINGVFRGMRVCLHLPAGVTGRAEQNNYYKQKMAHKYIILGKDKIWGGWKRGNLHTG